MSAPMISRENARCAILPISSLLAMLDTIPVLKKLPFSIGKLLFNERNEQFKREFMGVVMLEKLSLTKGTC